MATDFPVVSDKETQAPVGLPDAEEGKPVLLEETMFAPVPGSDPFKYGQRVGELKLVGYRIPGGKAKCSIVFRFDDDGAEAWASAELLVGQVSIGDGEFQLTGGTKRFSGRKDKYSVKVKNPKRWG